MIRTRKTIYAAALGLLAIGAVSCTDDATAPSGPTTVFGTTKTIAGGNVRSFMTTDTSGNPTEVGIRISAATVNGVPMTPPADPMEYMYQIELPAGVATKTAIKDLSLDWGPMGHPPMTIYDTAHFDMHFYTATMNERMTWTGVGADSARLHMIPNASLVPPMHMTDSSGIPMMGMHFVNVTSGEFSGTPFNSTFIWGYYNGKQAFIEPMITRWFLQSKAAFTAAIPQPAQYSYTGVYWPTKYSVSFDAATNEHVVTMSDMVKR